MIRSIFGCLGRVLQLIRNHIKPLILLTSFATFVWLIVSTTNRPEFTRHSHSSSDAGVDSFADINPDQRWSKSSVDIFLRLLDIEGNLTSLVVQSQDEMCPLKDETVFSAFIDDSLEENLWQYYTLIALRQNLAFSSEGGFVIVPFLPQSTKQRLERIFDVVPMDIISDLPFDCYDIGNAVIINSSTEIMRPKSRDQIHILDSGTRRYRDLVATDWNSESSQLSLQAANVARQRLSRLRDLGVKIRPDNQTGVEFVGIYIQLDDSLPFDYFYRAITFQRKLHFARLIFVVICEDPQSALCERIHAPKEEIYVQPMKANNPGYDFALMSLCNHTIISNHMGIFHALNNGGDVVVYEFEQTDVRIRYLPWLLANELDSWYMLA
ncbi:uncharacterized protein LOC109422982 [Aedes albopictus]|uniref:Secreted protein n=1 Tax=Aedes albopictus TaxID=7160 RepID=A0ABM1YC69_AEDAL|nr:uncharacterized protein LOC109403576 [Aedes albopictus]